MAKVSASQNTVELSFTHSVATLVKHHFPALPSRGLDHLADATLVSQPLTLFDVNGQPLFHDYALSREGSVVGTIRTAANRSLGSPVISITHTAPGWTPERALRLATESLHAKEAKSIIQDWQLVVYAYPKVGIRLHFKLPGKKQAQSQIFDVASGDAVASSREPDHQFTQYSLLDSLKPSEIAARRKLFAKAEAHIQQLKAAEPALFVPSQPTTQAVLAKVSVSVIQLGIRQGLVLLSPYCPNSPIGLTHYSQITNYFCVPASAQMLMEHYGWNYTQNQIATAMGTSAAQGGTNGTGLTSGFASLTHNSLPLSFDNGGTRDQQFQDAINEISANRPLFTQVPHHYRVCVGYSENLLEVLFLELGLSQMLYIYDPWPWNTDLCQGGAIYWESWATSPVMWFGIVRHA